MHVSFSNYTLKDRLMKRTQYLAALAIAVMTGCGTTKTVVTEPAQQEVQPVQPQASATPIQVDANPEFATIQELVSLLEQKDNTAVIAKKYGYKSVSPYAVYRLDVYKTMLYKNCRPAKTVGSSMYEDTPKPLRKGTSSYVAIKEDITIGVFNAAAYGNLVQQLSAAGFTLVSDGHEQEYSNGTITAYCYEARKTVRLEKN